MVLLEDAVPPWADGVDATPGDPTTGTALDASLIDGFRSTLDSVLHSTANPLLTPKAITDEVKTARGATASLDARISTVIDSGGGLLNVDQFVEGLQIGHSLGGVRSWLWNDDFRLWSLGDALAPDGWTLAGAGAAIARCGTGLADTQRYGIGDFVARVTFGAAAATLSQDVIPSGTIATRALQMLRQLTLRLPQGVTFGPFSQQVGVAVAVFASTANQAYIRAVDGVGGGSSDFHPGDGTWRILGTPHAVNSAATKLGVELHVDITGGPVYFSAPFLIPYPGQITLEGSVGVFNTAMPFRFPGCPVTRREHTLPLLAGNQTVRNNIWRWMPRRACIITDVQLSATTGPTVTALRYDLKSWDGAAFTSMFTATFPEIAAGATYGGLQPNGTYARRCLNPFYGAVVAAGGEVRLDCLQIGTVAGADVAVTIGYLEYDRAMETFYDHNTE